MSTPLAELMNRAAIAAAELILEVYHRPVVAMEKADVAMRLAMKVRNKAVDAYQEIMRMSI